MPIPKRNSGEKETDFIQRCMSDEKMKSEFDTEQRYAICVDALKFATNKISFDFDGTINTDKGLQMALEYKKKGSVVYIISARSDKQSMYPRANKAGILFSRIFATGSNKAKIEKIRELGIDTHYDNNPDVIKELGPIGKLI